jgi:hypothetical protein
MERLAARNRFPLAAAAAILATTLLEVWFATGFAGTRATLRADDLATPLAAAIATAACARAATRHVGRMRLFWWLLAARPAHAGRSRR